MGTSCAHRSPIRLWCQAESRENVAPWFNGAWTARQAGRKPRQCRLWQQESRCGDPETANSRFMSTGWARIAPLKFRLTQWGIHGNPGETDGSAGERSVATLIPIAFATRPATFSAATSNVVSSRWAQTVVVASELHPSPARHRHVSCPGRAGRPARPLPGHAPETGPRRHEVFGKRAFWPFRTTTALPWPCPDDCRPRSGHGIAGGTGISG